MSQSTTIATTIATTTDCIFEHILGFMLPFFLAAAGGDKALARAVIVELAEAYNAATATELELVGRILGFSTVAMDNLRISMNPEMSDTKVLRYRSNAIALSRAGEQCRKILETVQAKRGTVQKPVVMPQPKIVPAPEPKAAPVSASKIEPAATPGTAPSPPPQAVKETARPQSSAPNAIGMPRPGTVPLPPMDIEAMKRDARQMLAAFSRDGVAAEPSGTAFPFIPETDAMIDAAVKEAMAAFR
jgi:hypothetical protein